VAHGRGWLLGHTVSVPIARLGMIGTSSSVPCHYPGTLSSSVRDCIIMWKFTYAGAGCDLKPKTNRWWRRRRARQRDTFAADDDDDDE